MKKQSAELAVVRGRWGYDLVDMSTGCVVVDGACRGLTLAALKRRFREKLKRYCKLSLLRMKLPSRFRFPRKRGAIISVVFPHVSRKDLLLPAPA